MKNCFRVCLTILACFTGLKAQTNLKAWNTRGQTFLVWEGSTQTDSIYDIYISHQPITSISSASWAGRVFGDNGRNYRLSEFISDARWVIPDSTGTNPVIVDTNQIYFVYTPHHNDTAYFAVVLAGDTLVDTNNTTGPVIQTVDTPQPWVQFQNDSVTVYGHWIDGRADDSCLAGYPVMGNQFSNGYGFNFAVWQPWTGLPSSDTVMLVWIHGGTGNLMQLWDLGLAQYAVPYGLLLTLDDPLRTKVADSTVDQNTFWFGYQKGLNRFEPRLPGPNDTIKDYTAQRIWWETEWVKQNWTVNPERVSIMGPSMGGLGTLFHSQFRSDMFSAAYAQVPVLRMRSRTQPNSVLYIFGDSLSNIVTNLPGNPGVYDVLSQDWRLSQAHSDWPFTMIISGVNDERVPWEVNARVYCQLDSARTGFWLYWDERGHFGDEWPGAHFYGSKHLNSVFITQFQKDLSFPAFSGTDLWPDSAGRQPDTSQDWGTWGGYLDFDQSSIVDSPDLWSVRLWVVHQSPYPNDIPESDTILTDITPRKTSRFKAEPGQVYQWELIRVAGGDTVQQGICYGAADSTATAQGVLLTKEDLLFVIHRSTGVSEDPGKLYLKPVIIPNPMSGKGVLRFALKSPDVMRLDIFNPAGQLVKQLQLGSLEPGQHRISISVEELGPGVYFYLLTGKSGSALWGSFTVK